MRTSSPTMVIALIALVIVAFLALLYAYRAQTPTGETPGPPIISNAEAVQHVNAGRVRIVNRDGGEATLELVDGTRTRTMTPSAPDDPLSAAIRDYNRGLPAGASPIVMSITIDHVSTTPFWLPFLPFLILIPLVFLGVVASSRARAGDR